MSKKGFTLIELLVTISIIAILATIGLVAYSSVMKQGRDSKRQSDLRSIQSALEQYYSDQGFYPSGAFKLYLMSGAAFTSTVLGNPSPPVTKTYMNSLPKDPQSTAYDYQVQPSSPVCNNNPPTPTFCTSYCLYANLESLPSPAPSLPAGCPSVSNYNFAVTPSP